MDGRTITYEQGWLDDAWDRFNDYWFTPRSYDPPSTQLVKYEPPPADLGWRNPWDKSKPYLAPVARGFRLAQMGFNQIYDYVRGDRANANVGELGYGVLQRGGTVHPDITVKKELAKLAKEAKKSGDWEEYNRHQEGISGPRTSPVYNQELERARWLHSLRKRHRQVQKFRYFRRIKGKKGKKWRRSYQRD